MQLVNAVRRITGRRESNSRRKDRNPSPTGAPLWPERAVSGFRRFGECGEISEALAKGRGGCREDGASSASLVKGQVPAPGGILPGSSSLVACSGRLWGGAGLFRAIRCGLTRLGDGGSPRGFGYLEEGA